ncbi:hypothetical protein [Brytella acorum]|nr:hypothetical protein [Brytella acorum]
MTRCHDFPHVHRFSHFCRNLIVEASGLVPGEDLVTTGWIASGTS